jgi:hypothetical protein
MLGSISKIRPCGHHHYYKYAHATEGTHPTKHNGKKYDMYQVSREYWNDVDEDNCWNFSLENATALVQCCFELGRFTKFKSKTPKLTNAFEMFTGDNGQTSPAITEIEMDYDNLTNVNCLFYGMELTDLPANFNPKTTILHHLLGGGCAKSIGMAHNNIFPYYEVLNNATSVVYLMRHDDCAMDDNYTFEKATNVNSMCFCNTSRGPLSLSKKLSFKNVKTMNSLVSQQDYEYLKPPYITFFQTVDEMSNLTTAVGAFYHCTQLSSLYPDYESFSWPKLSDATNMFYKCILDKPSIIKLSNALPDWSNDTAAHNITIGCHIDHKYDPEVNLALKKLQSSYITPIEELGGSLSETVTSDKKWTITVQWNGTKTTNAYPEPEL